ncbi:MAG: ubiquinone biosynthesis methyltransferase UbiE [Hyphomicrobiales bacterium]|uniref:ubiquinone biosynthesis methyltransferase UbiE n=1 Tax=Aestuariivirga sp. TaxID=2650926 RepID=UPI0035B10BA6
MSGTRPLVEISMGIEAFASEWLHCDRISTYLARMVSHNRTDSLLYANLLSSALNELLETAFAHHGPKGDFSCRVSRIGEADVIELDLPCDAAALVYYSTAAQRLKQSDLADVYHSALFSPGNADPHLGLLEVAVDYRARISIVPENGNRLKLAAEMTLEGTAA